jgi:nicotinamide phosphoribosyltransferase
VFPKGIKGMHAYIEARSSGDVIVPFGLQMFLFKFFTTQITVAMVDEAEAFAKLHGEPFDTVMWLHVIDKYDGYFPLKIRAVPEGTRVPSHNAIVTIETDDNDELIAPLAMYLETAIQRAVWYPTTIASNDYKNWLSIKMYAALSANTLANVPFSLHDFGGRGVTCAEQAEIGGAAHLVYFMGSDTIEGVRAANFYYKPTGGMAAFSVPASEHSIQCSFGQFNQVEYLENMLNVYAKPGAIVSIVIDGYDTFREAQVLCSMKEKIIASGARVVFRPDSGDPLEVIPRLLQMQEIAFGSKLNTKGYKVINNVGIIQGDGIDHESMVAILAKVTGLGYSTDNIVFGSGGGLLQKVNRDTFKFAQKASAIKVANKWVGIFKDPITDHGKKSKTGRQTLVKSRSTGEYMTVNLDEFNTKEWEDVMVTVYDHGKITNTSTLDEIRARAQA